MKVYLYVSNGEVDDDYEPIVTVNKGSVESDVLTVTQDDEDDPNRRVAVYFVVVNGKPSAHLGYSLSYDTNQALVVIDAPGEAPAGNSQMPTETAFLPNYPNPFNPETWIPYQLSEAAEVSITIYDAQGTVIRKLALGQKPAGYYTDRKRAAHWDGRNNLGEKVAAGVIYFITFNAGDYTCNEENTNKEIVYNIGIGVFLSLHLRQDLMTVSLLIYERKFKVKKVFVFLSIFLILGLQITSFAEITSVVDRTTQVRDAIVAAADVNSTSDVTETQLAAITSLNLRLKGITELKSGDFSGMTGLTDLNLYGNELSTLPDKIFNGLTALTRSDWEETVLTHYRLQ